ncbi:flippase, partial [Bacillus wiedmannii]|nr:flippase [Bacillus wiedmannii]
LTFLPIAFIIKKLVSGQIIQFALVILICGSTYILILFVTKDEILLALLGKLQVRFKKV